MTRRKNKTRKKLGALSTVSLLLIFSAIIRMGEHAGQALAREPEHVPSTGPQISPVNPSVVENVLSALAEREARVAEQEEKVALRISALEEAELDISKKLKELRDAEKALRDTLAIADSAAEDDLVRLTNVYENMKPKEAAELFEAMDSQFAAGFLGRMKPTAAAGIMAGLSAEAAYAISAVIAGRNASAPKQ